MLKKPIVWNLFLTLVLLATGCTNQDSPEATLERFMRGMIDFDFHAMAIEVDPDVTGYNNIWAGGFDSNQGNDIEQMLNEYYRENAASIQYQFSIVDKASDHSRILIQFTFADGGPWMKDALREFNAFTVNHMTTGLGSNPEESAAEGQRLLFEILKGQLSNTERDAQLEKEIEMQLIRNNDRWYIAGSPWRSSTSCMRIMPRPSRKLAKK